MKLNLTDLDMLKEVANIGTGNAATSLSSLINKKIGMEVPSVKVPEFKDLSNYIGGPDALIAGVLIKVTGDIEGMMIYIMREEAACNLANELLSSSNLKSFSEFSEMENSMITEIGNILTSSYLTALSKLMNYEISQSVPSLSIDMAQAILSVPAIELGKVADKAIFIESKFKQLSDENIGSVSGYFMFVPQL